MNGAKIVITGAPIAPENDPNTTPPDETRLSTSPIQKRGGGPREILYYLADGTSAAVSVWMRDETLSAPNNWVLLESGILIAAALAVVKSVWKTVKNAWCMVYGIHWLWCNI